MELTVEELKKLLDDEVVRAVGHYEFNEVTHQKLDVLKEALEKNFPERYVNMTAIVIEYRRLHPECTSDVAEVHLKQLFEAGKLGSGLLSTKRGEE